MGISALFGGGEGGCCFFLFLSLCCSIGHFVTLYFNDTQWQLRKQKEVFAEISLWEEGQTGFRVIPFSWAVLLRTEQYMIMYICVEFLFVWLLWTDGNLLLTLGLDAADRSLRGLAALASTIGQNSKKWCTKWSHERLCVWYMWSNWW